MNENFDVTKFWGSQKYIKAADLEGRARVLTIRSVVIEKVNPRNDDESKPVLYFLEEKKGLVVNTTNGKTIVAAYGKNPGSWSGKPLEVYPTTCDMAGEEVDCVRVRIPLATAAPVAATVAAPVAAPVAAAVGDGDSIPF